MQNPFPNGVGEQTNLRAFLIVPQDILDKYGYQIIGELLDKDVLPRGVVVWSGLLDSILPSNGTLMAIRNMQWKGNIGFQTKPAAPLIIDGKTRGMRVLKRVSSPQFSLDLKTRRHTAYGTWSDILRE